MFGEEDAIKGNGGQLISSIGGLAHEFREVIVNISVDGVASDSCQGRHIVGMVGVIGG